MLGVAADARLRIAPLSMHAQDLTRDGVMTGKEMILRSSASVCAADS